EPLEETPRNKKTNLDERVLYVYAFSTSERLVKQLALPTIVHPTSYRLQQLSEKGELLVDKQTKVMLTLGGYDDRVVGDVVPMKAIHLLLGRHWQFGKKVIHDGITNRHSYIWGKRLCLNLCLQEGTIIYFAY
ncbi:hypothetical protein CR513_10927, partial [Mucuna pruriens]